MGMVKPQEKIVDILENLKFPFKNLQKKFFDFFIDKILVRSEVLIFYKTY